MATLPGAPADARSESAGSVDVLRDRLHHAVEQGQITAALEYENALSESGDAAADDMTLMARMYVAQRDCKDATQWSTRAMAAFAKTPFEANNSAYWSQLLRIERQGASNDRDLLMIYRVMYHTHSMGSDRDYIEMAQLLLDADLPAEARGILTTAFAEHAIGEESRVRASRLLQVAEERAIIVRPRLPCSGHSKSA